ncbi:MAG: hypothetical protein DCC71_08050 [Proteobacteria bacterium]|nr:MAG: hypothetical protein DCC71_08050 [Pseudomonadota bacterium]
MTRTTLGRLGAACALASLLAVAAPRSAADAVDPRTLAPLLRAGDVAAVEERLAAWESSSARTREGWLAMPRALFALGVAAVEDPSIEEPALRWVQQSPSWKAWMVEGWRLVMLGKLPRSASRAFDEIEIWMPDPSRAAEARAAFERARALAPRSSEPDGALLGLDVAERRPLAARTARLESACAVDAACETARSMMLTGLEPHMGGSIELLLSFARESAARHPDDPRIGLLVAIAHRKAALANGRPDAWFHQPGVFDEADRSYVRHLTAHPNAVRQRNERARAACWAGRRETARGEFEAIADRFVATAWKGGFREFATRRAWALGARPSASLAGIAP